MMELTDVAKAEFRQKLEKSVVSKRLYRYIFGLEYRNYEVFDRLVMIMLNFGEVAFVYALSAVRAMDSDPLDTVEEG